MASGINLRLSKEELANLVNSYLVLGDFLEDVIGPERLYKDSFVRGMREALCDYGKRRVKKVENIYDLIA